LKVGEIPAHWEVMGLKRLADVRGGVTKGRKLGDVKVLELPYLRVANVQDGYIDTNDVATIEILPEELERYSLRKGDVLMNEGGDNDKLGRGAVWDAHISPCLHQNHVFAVRPQKSDLSDWITLVTSSSYAKFYFYSRAKQSTNLASISATNIKRFPIVLPPMEERLEILRYVAAHESKTEHAFEKATSAIDRLKEYRTAIITSAVTGSIDVRNVPIPNDL
jgi:type I restriction enzyme, S subunit